MHAMSASGAVCAPAPSPLRSADAPLLALAPELEAAATPYLAFDRDQLVTVADPDHVEARATSRDLWNNVEAVAERIFAHRPTTLPGLLLVAHAAAVTAEETWQEAAEHVGQDGRLLRLVCDGLFRLAGVDWRGRPIPGARPPAEIPTLAEVDPGPDPELAAMVAEWQAIGTAIDAPGSTGDAESEYERWTTLQREILARPCRTVADLCAKLPVFRQELEDVELEAPDQGGEDVLQLAAWRGLVQDIEALSGAPTHAPRVSAPTSPSAAPTPSLDAALIPLAEAAIAEERRVTALSVASSNDLPPGSFARSMQLLELVSGSEAQTPAGLAAKARVLLTHIPEVDELEGDWRCEALSLSIARDAVALSAAPPMGAVEAAWPDPIFAAIEASRQATAEHADFCKSPAWGPPEGDAEADRLCCASADAWQALIRVTPRTADGARAMAAYAADMIVANPGTDEDELAELLRRLAGVPADALAAAPAMLAAE